MLNNNIKYINNFLLENEKNMILNWLNEKQFKNGINNDKSIIKRQQLWFQKEQKPFNKDWIKFDWWNSETEYDDILFQMESLIKLYLKENNINIGVNINSCLVNKYENGQKFIKFHQDSNKAFGNHHYIILYSIGEPRTMRFRNINDFKDTFDITLESNSLVIIYPEINIIYEHSIIKDDTQNTRYSFTFREFIS
jgi:alkylated DNA repair dioxygenase AlkB